MGSKENTYTADEVIDVKVNPYILGEVIDKLLKRVDTLECEIEILDSTVSELNAEIYYLKHKGGRQW